MCDSIRYRPDGTRCAPTKVGFVLVSNEARPQPSTRIAALNLFPRLRAAGFEPTVVYQPPIDAPVPGLPDFADALANAGFRAVVFQKVSGDSVLAQVHRLRLRGVRTIFSVCDFVIEPMVRATDATITVTEYLRSLHPPDLLQRVHVVHDGIEREDIFKQAWHAGSGGRLRPLQAVLVTSSQPWRLPSMGDVPPWLRMNIVGAYPSHGRPLRRLRELNWAMAGQTPREQLRHLRFLLNRRVDRTPWDPAAVYRHLLAADIGVIPVDHGPAPEASGPDAPWRVKSENRLTLKMSAALPVVASPIPAYERVIEHGVNGFLARSRADWQRCLSALRDPDLRREMGLRARASVLPRFSQAEQARRFVAVLRDVLGEKSGARQPAPMAAAGD